MIRNVVLGRLRHNDDHQEHAAQQARLESALEGIRDLDLVGCLSNQVGFDARLREGGWDFAITNDWADAEAYRAYDTDATHGHYRATIVEICSEVARVQFEIAD